jgi:hypothetical protein
MATLVEWWDAGQDRKCKRLEVVKGARHLAVNLPPEGKPLAAALKDLAQRIEASEEAQQESARETRGTGLGEDEPDK